MVECAAVARPSVASPRPPERAYGLLGRHYDRVMNGHAGLFRRARLGLLRDILPGVGSVCDLGCGSGATALEFARRGRRVIAVDLSAAQVGSVRRKARAAGLPVRVLCADMRGLVLPEPVDLVLCEFDALNHLPRHADLRPTLRSVHRALHPGGWFLFDVNTRRGYTRLWTRPGSARGRDFRLVQTGVYDPGRRQALLRQEWSLRTAAGWRARTEILREVCWPLSEIRAALRAAGFVLVRQEDGARFFAGWDWEEPGCRVFFLARRPPTRSAARSSDRARPRGGPGARRSPVPRPGSARSRRARTPARPGTAGSARRPRPPDRSPAR